MFHVALIDLIQSRVMRALIIAPVGEPVLRFSARIANALESQAAIDVSHHRLLQVAVIQGLQVGYKIPNLTCGKTLAEVVWHERFLIDLNRGKCLPVEQVESTRHIDYLQ